MDGTAATGRSLEEQRQAEEDANAAGKAADPREGDAPDGEQKADLEGEGDGEKAPPAIPPLAIEADGQLTLTVGGEKPTQAMMKLRGGKIAVGEGDFDKGKVVDLVVKVQIAEVHFIDKRDGQTGEVTSVDRVHVGKIIGIERLKD